MVDNSSTTCRARSYLARMWAREILSHDNGKNYDTNQSVLDSFLGDTSFSTQVFNHMGALKIHTMSACDFHLHEKSIICPHNDLDAPSTSPAVVPKKRPLATAAPGRLNGILKKVRRV